MSHIKLVTPGPLASSSLPTMPIEPFQIDGQPAYIDKNLISSCSRTGRLEYLVEWEGNSPKE